MSWNTIDLKYEINQTQGGNQMNVHNYFRLTNHLLAGSIGVLVFIAPLNAQILEEVTVTAQKREQSMQDVGIALTAFTGNQIEQMGFQNAIDIASQTPGLTTTNIGGSESWSIFSLRGLSQSDFTENQEAPVAVYEDETYFSLPSMSGVPLYDLERVEVLKGPQGTLFGRNATGGLVHYLSKRPTEEFEGYGKVTIGNYDLYRGEGAVSGAITENVLGRLSFRVSRRDGWLKNLIGPDFREDESTAFRGQLLFKISENTDLLVKAYGDIIDRALVGTYGYRASEAGPDGLSRFCTGCGFFLDQNGDGIIEDTDGNGNYTISLNATDPNKTLDRELYGATAKLQHSADAFNVTWIVDYKDYKKDYAEDADGTFVDEATFISDTDLQQFSTEFRLDGELKKIRWITGLYYLNVENEFSAGFPFPASGYFPEYFASQDTESIGGFVQFDYDLSDTLVLIAGARLTQDKKDMDYRFTCVGFDILGFCPPDPGFLQDFVPREYDRSDTLWSGTIRLDWRAFDDHLIYASINRGTKGGGFNAPLDGFLTDAQVPFRPETVIAYELGFKGMFLGDRLQFNAGAFYYDYDDYQAFIFSGTTSNLVNHQAEVYGAEVSLRFAPSEGWDLIAGLSLLDATVEDVLGIGIDQDIILAPDVTVNAIARKYWTMSNGGALSLQLDANYADKQQFNTVNHPVTLGGEAFVVNTRMQYTTANERWEVGFYVNNIFEDEYETWVFDITAFDNFSLINHNPPRMIGGDIRLNF